MLTRLKEAVGLRADEPSATSSTSRATPTAQPPMKAPDIENLVQHGAVFYVAHSGGKDSQCMYARVRRRVPHERIVVVHADLGKVEWRGVQDHIQATISHELHVVRAGKTFFDLVRHRAKTYPEVPAFPGAGRRQCTSDLKRDPILKFIRHDMKTRGRRWPSTAWDCGPKRAGAAAGDPCGH